MHLNWSEFTGQNITVTLQEQYGVVLDPHNQNAFYEIVFKSGTLIGTYDEGILLASEKNGTDVKFFIPFNAIKCAEIRK